MADVIRVRLGMTSAFLVRDNGGAVLVDTGLPGSCTRILAGVAKWGVEEKRIRLILITHGHSDHFGSARELHDRLGAPVAVHEADAPALRVGANNPEYTNPTSATARRLMKVAGRMGRSGAEIATEPQITFTGAWRLDDYGVSGEVIPCPGHTPGSSVVALDSGEVVAGDLVAGRLLGMAGTAGPPIVAWDLDRNRESVRALLDRGATTFYVAHGGPYSADQVRHYLDSV